jgi:dTDP-4-dehydrorhamnose reductase
LFLKDKLQTILVTGSNGQLGEELRTLATAYPAYQFLFVSKEDLPIDQYDMVSKYFAEHAIDFCINCAAYTAVDKAESEREKAFSINADAVGNLAAVCKTHHTRLIHISTDYVFDGSADQPYKESDKTSPVSVYGESKLKGEQLALENDPSSVIIRTSWLYSSYKNNFVKTMLRLMKEKDSINVVNDQFGCPTYAADLAKVILQIISSGMSIEKAGIYHYTNSGITNWYEFAVAINKLSDNRCIVNPIPTVQYPTPAKRPHYSVMDTDKIKQAFQVAIPGWEDSLQKCLKLLQ